MTYIDFWKLFSRHGGYSLPVLIILDHPNKKWYFTNNKFDIFYGSPPIQYKAVTMSWKFPTSTNGVPQGGTLEIDLDINDNGYELLRWFDEADDRASIRIIGLINERGEISPINYLIQKHGKVSWDGERITWNPSADDRLNMQVNPYVLDEDALLG